MNSLWTPKLQLDFHKAVAALREVTEMPIPDITYPEPTARPVSKGQPVYTLRPRDELQLADRVALLAHAKGGVLNISGACVEEAEDGLTIRLASNSTPPATVITGIQSILRTMSLGATQSEWNSHRQR